MVFLNTAAARFVEAGRYLVGSLFHGGFALGDMNADGINDLVVAPGATVLTGWGDGTFRAARPSVGPPPQALGDFNGDGLLDVLAVDSFERSGFFVLFNQSRR